MKLKHPFLTACSLNAPVLTIWYILEAAQFGQLQHGRFCDDTVFLIYFGITWALLSLMGEKYRRPSGSTGYIAVIRGTKNMPIRYLAGEGVTDDATCADMWDTPEKAMEAAKKWPNAEPMAATVTLTLTPLPRK